MAWINVAEIVIVVICAITYGFMLYFRVKGDVLGAVSELIALAEETGLAGKEKMAQVVDSLYEKVPAPLKKALNKKILEKISQTIFDWMRRYADEHQKAKEEEPGKVKSEEEIKSELTAAAGDLTAELLKLTAAELREKAEANSIELNGATKKDDIFTAVLVALLKKQA